MKKLQTWLDIPADSDFSIYNLPFGIFSTKTKSKRVGIAIGRQIIDVSAVARLGYLNKLDIPKNVLVNDYLNDFIDLGKRKTNGVRLEIQKMLLKNSRKLRDKRSVFVDQRNAVMHMPVRIGDYTDFYSSIEHATNVGKMFRDPQNALLPNWKHIPVGYHGRSSSIILSGENIHRPKGQVLPNEATKPVFQPTARLDMELEMAFIVGKSTNLGASIPVEKAEDYIFGMVLFNDWSARDIQKWEYVPLGPFLAKSFASSISPWVVTLEALAPYKVAAPKQTPKPLPYLQLADRMNIDIDLEVALTPPSGSENIICKSNYKYMYWNMSQQLAHHTVNGCNVNVGDMMASGTISGKDEKSFGSMLELAWGGKKPITLNDGSTRVFFKDGDTVTLRGHCEKDGMRVGFGEVTTKILPAN